MSDDPCTATGSDGIPPNPLFTPPCACARCAPTVVYDHDDDTTTWLRIDGRAQRYRVERHELGETGRTLL